MNLRVGQTLHSAVDAATVIVVRAPGADVTVACAGAEMLVDKPEPTPAQDAPGSGDAVQLGKRYADETVGIELLCTKAGAGPLEVNGSVLPLKDAKPLPASD